MPDLAAGRLRRLRIEVERPYSLSSPRTEIRAIATHGHIFTVRRAGTSGGYLGPTVSFAWVRSRLAVARGTDTAVVCIPSDFSLSACFSTAHQLATANGMVQTIAIAVYGMSPHFSTPQITRSCATGTP